MWKLEKQILTDTLNLLQSSKELKEISEDPSPPVLSRAPAVDETATTSATSSANANKKKKKKAKKAKAKEAATPAPSS